MATTLLVGSESNKLHVGLPLFSFICREQQPFGNKQMIPKTDGPHWITDFCCLRPVGLLHSLHAYALVKYVIFFVLLITTKLSTFLFLFLYVFFRSK